MEKATLVTSYYSSVECIQNNLIGVTREVINHPNMLCLSKNNEGAEKLGWGGNIGVEQVPVTSLPH